MEYGAFMHMMCRSFQSLLNWMFKSHNLRQTKKGRYLHTYIYMHLCVVLFGSRLRPWSFAHLHPNSSWVGCFPQILWASGLLSTCPFMRHVVPYKCLELRLACVIRRVFFVRWFYVCIPSRLECVLLLRLACVIAGFPKPCALVSFIHIVLPIGALSSVFAMPWNGIE